MPRIDHSAEISAKNSQVWEVRLPDSVPSMGSHRVGHDWSDLAAAAAAAVSCCLCKAYQTFVFLTFAFPFPCLPHIWSVNPTPTSSFVFSWRWYLGWGFHPFWGVTWFFWISFMYVHVYVCVCVHALSDIWLFVTPWTVAHQAPLSTIFSKQGYWSRVFYTPGHLPDPGIEPISLCLLGKFFTLSHLGSPFGLFFSS